MPDKMLECQDCKQEFVFTEGEQAFYESKDFTPPKRCKPCRDKKKAQRDGGGGGGQGGRDRR
ncbi:MAG TPA: zinc-ribbon domain containing protein [Phycisphaerae bacterium]|nr:zinc-ribbon domain containing protein [Phycisphaerae bacterium]HUU59194.1 zinc-ribbon domain containing protein [Phycisphaerae bacterium]